MPQVWSRDLGMPADALPRWMLELAEQVGMIEPELLTAGLPTGVIVGSAVIEKVTSGDDVYEWHLGEVERVTRLRKPTGHPQPVWFTPF